MEMKLHLNTGEILTIQVVNHPLIHQWVKRFCSLPLALTEVSRLENRSSVFNKDLFDSLFSKLTKGVKAYSGPNFVIQDYNDHTAIQQLLNDMHHWCVETVQDKHMNQDYPEYHSDVALLGELNSLCHQCETLLTSGTNALPESCRYVYWDQPLQEDWKHRIPLTDEWLDLMTTEKHDVYVAKRILGKDYREAYRDNDDPTYDEMQPIGDRVPLALEFDPLNQWQDLFKLPEFLEYLPVPPTARNIGRIPVGNLVNNVDNIQEILYNSRIVKAELVESV